MEVGIVLSIISDNMLLVSITVVFMDLKVLVSSKKTLAPKGKTVDSLIFNFLGYIQSFQCSYAKGLRKPSKLSPTWQE